METRLRPRGIPGAAVRTLLESETHIVPIVVGDALPGGLLVVEILPGSPAFHSDLRLGDSVVRIDRVDVADAETREEGTVRERLTACDPGSSVRFSICREGQAIETNVKFVKDATNVVDIETFNIFEYEDRSQGAKFRLFPVVRLPVELLDRPIDRSTDRPIPRNISRAVGGGGPEPDLLRAPS